MPFSAIHFETLQRKARHTQMLILARKNAVDPALNLQARFRQN
jgi:hypothetical protein